MWLPVPGINRTILECKIISAITIFKFIFSINRTILECKNEMFDEIDQRLLVLIEPYWNVKA